MKISGPPRRLLVLVAALLAFGCHNGVLADQSDEQCANGPVIGIHLGNTNAVVGSWENGRVKILENEDGNRIIPAYVAFTNDGQRLVGEAAKNQSAINPQNTIFDMKRLIGRTFNDESLEKDIKSLPFEIMNKEGKPFISIESNLNGEKRAYYPEEILAILLKKMKEIAESYTGKPCTNSVLTVPAYFNDAQRQATEEAATIAGITVMRIIDEPTAAAIAYGLDTRMKEKNILVIDIGGSTHHVTLLSINEGGFHVLAMNNDTHLGGENFDERVVEWAMNIIKQKHGVDLSSNHSALSLLRREAEKAKKALSTAFQTKLQIKGLIDGQDFSETLTRKKFEELNIDLFKKSINPVSALLKAAGLKKSEVHEVILSGGSTRIPKVQSLLKDFFNGKELNKQIPPDEVVAYGATIQAEKLGIVEKQIRDTACFPETTVLSFGIETIGGIMTKFIERYSIIPTKKISKIFTTSIDNQSSVFIKIYAGERSMTKDNQLIGQLELIDLPPVRRGVLRILVTFEIDANGVLVVAAEVKDRGGKKEKITIGADKSRSVDELERMINEAEQFAEEDRKVKERIEGINRFRYLKENMLPEKEKDYY